MSTASGSEFRDDIAAGLTAAVVLFVRHLAYGQSLAQSTVLAQLDDDGAIRLTALATATGVSQPSMTQLIARMEREELVHRFDDPADGRATLVEITDQGRGHRRATRDELQTRLNELLQTLPPEDEASLALAMRVAGPIVEELSRHAGGMRKAL